MLAPVGASHLRRGRTPVGALLSPPVVAASMARSPVGVHGRRLTVMGCMGPRSSAIESDDSYPSYPFAEEVASSRKKGDLPMGELPPCDPPPDLFQEVDGRWVFGTPED